MFSTNATCEAMTQAERQAHLANEVFDAWNVTERNFEEASHMHRGKCPSGYKIGPHLRPRERCLDEFTLQETRDGRIVIKSRRDIHESTNFCINFEEGSSVSAEVCVPEDDAAKFRYSLVSHHNLIAENNRLEPSAFLFPAFIQSYYWCPASSSWSPCWCTRYTKNC